MRWRAIPGCLLLVLSGCVEDSEPDTDNEPDMQVDASPPDMAPVIDAGDPPPDMRPLPDMLRPPMPGDPCADPVDLNAAGMGMGGEIHYQTQLSGQPSVLQGSCGGNGPEQVLSFVAPSAGRWYFSTDRPGTMFDTVLYVQTACGQPGSEIACNDDGGMGFQSQVAVDLAADQQVFVVLDSFGRAGGEATLAFGQASLSALDGPCDGITLICPEDTICYTDRGDGARTCRAIRERAVGEFCDPQGRLGPCVAGAVCYGFRAPTCEEVRERALGERCDPQGTLGPCVAGAICDGVRDDAICEEVRERQEGERCDPRGGTGPCAEGLVCRQLGERFDDTFCVVVEVLEEGAICALDGSTGQCEEGTLCQAADDMAPTCVRAEPACPDDWPVIDLNASPGGRGWRVEAALAPDAVVNTRLCRGAQARLANVFVFVAAADGRHTFETLPPAQGEGFDTLLDVRRFCGFAGNDSVIACDDDGGAMFYSRADVALAAGETVYVLVGPTIGDGGGYVLEVTGPGDP